MRITGGELCGRKVKAPKGSVRPTQDMVREALFSMLASQIPGSRFLDLFAGAGTVGLEAWSRGAESVQWVEKDRNVFSVLKRNVEELTGSGEGIFSQDVFRFLKNYKGQYEFDYIFADPPYGGDQGKLMENVKSSNMLSDNGLLVLEQGAKEAVLEEEGWKVIDTRVYGSAGLRYYKKCEVQQ